MPAVYFQFKFPHKMRSDLIITGGECLNGKTKKGRGARASCKSVAGDITRILDLANRLGNLLSSSLCLCVKLIAIETAHGRNSVTSSVLIRIQSFAVRVYRARDSSCIG